MPGQQFRFIYKQIKTIIVTIGYSATTNITEELHNISTINLFTVFGIVATVFSLLLRATANEMAVDKDRNYTVAVFFEMVSFAAIAIALISFLSKGAQ